MLCCQETYGFWDLLQSLLPTPTLEDVGDTWDSNRERKAGLGGSMQG